jgi:hypothetical protein
MGIRGSARRAQRRKRLATLAAEPTAGLIVGSAIRTTRFCLSSALSRAYRELLSSLAVIKSPLLIGASNVESKMTRMGVARISVGLSTVNPNVGAKIFGAPADQVTTTTRLLARFFAIRNIVLGSWVLTMRDANERDRRRCAQLNLAVDAADLAAIIPVFARKDMRRTATMAALLAASATLGWLQILDEI